ncbi:MAG: RNA-binding transcriptional accessory protein [Muribaculaceae bacterium]|nr:RNA-binding transcriptional accessory protein [Muribaculaceae bacterium]
MDFALAICNKTGLPHRGIAATIALLEQGATIPFISRYRKEVTGGLDEVQIFNISQIYDSLTELQRRKQTVIQTITEQNAMTPELLARIEEITEPNELEDLYLPYKPKRRTRAAIAREQGLEPLARLIMSQNPGDPVKAAVRFLNDKVATTDDALKGAMDIAAEWVSEHPRNRNTVRNRFRREAVIESTVIKGKEDEGEKYRSYFNWSEPLRRCSSHRYLAMRRGEAEGILKVNIKIDDDSAIQKLCENILRKGGNPQSQALLHDAIADSYKRLMRPSLENEAAAEARRQADAVAISAFADNVEQLLMAPPLRGKRVMAIDPGYRTGCKIVCLDKQGFLLHNDIIFPTPPTNDRKGAARRVSNIVEVYKIDAIALGNGTASRETEEFLQSMRFPRKVEVYVVSENGASIYSASKIAREEFPDYDVTVRGAVSIGRRLIDPLSELVKIDPKSIGVGQYQHDVDQTLLKLSLDNTVTNCVNRVGVNVNTASRQLLSYVSGIGPALADNIISYRHENGDFTRRSDLKKVPRLGEKAYEQAAGFLRIPEGENPLDNTSVHPESYHIVHRMADDLGCQITELIANKELISKIEPARYISETVGLPTLTDIIRELEKPGHDPRKQAEVMEFDPNVKTIEDLRQGMILNGIVNNITDFGVFVDIGIKQSGLVHISQLSDKRVASPRDIVNIHQHVRVKVLEVDLNRKRIALTMRGI